jgi:hypothetical protein
MKEIRTETEIKASPGKVWQGLTDFENHSKWNPFIRSISGDKTEGGSLQAELSPPGSGSMKINPEILVFEREKEFRWKGKMFIPGIFDGEHYFLISKNGNDSTRFVHGEKFNGILVGLLGNTLKKTRQGFEQMNEALKKECEK